MDDYDSSPDQSIRMKLNKTFTRYNYVGVKNILKTPLEQTVALEQNEMLGMSQGDPMNEERMAQTASGTFLPGDGATRNLSKITKYIIAPGQKKMVIGEAAYVLVERIYNAYIREKYGIDKAALAKLRSPSVQAEIIPLIVEGPIINNVGQAMETFVNTQMDKLEGFTDVQTEPSKLKGFANPEVLAKAKATREANRTKVEIA